MIYSLYLFYNVYLTKTNKAFDVDRKLKKNCGIKNSQVILIRKNMDVLIEHEKLSNFALKAQIKVTSTFIAILHFTYELVPI